jgi:hypothetical protein
MLCEDFIVGVVIILNQIRLDSLPDRREGLLLGLLGCPSLSFCCGLKEAVQGLGC